MYMHLLLVPIYNYKIKAKSTFGSYEYIASIYKRAKKNKSILLKNTRITYSKAVEDLDNERQY